MTVAEKLRLLRALRGWTQDELAKRTGIDRSVIGRYETRGGTPRYDSQIRFSRALQVQGMWLIGDNQQPVHAIFRPLNPFQEPSTTAAIGKLAKEIRLLLPKMLDDLDLTETVSYRCELGQVFIASSDRSVIAMILDKSLSDVVGDLDASQNQMQENHFVRLLLHPINGLRQPGLPPIFAYLAGLLPSSSAEIYDLPEEVTKVCFEVKNRDMSEIIASITNWLNDDLVRIEVVQDKNYLENIPEEIQQWLIKHGQTVDKNGNVVAR